MNRRFPQAELIQGDAENLPLPANSFNSVFCLEALVHYPEPGRAISEMARVVKPGGDVVLSFDNDMGIQRKLREMQKRYFRRINPDFRSGGQGIYRALSREDVLSWVDEAGLEAEETYAVGVIPPVKLKSMDGVKRWYLISPSVSNALAPVDGLLSKTKFGKRLAAYYVVHAKKV
jgi:SAM-dependent methyltransferase